MSAAAGDGLRKSAKTTAMLMLCALMVDAKGVTESMKVKRLGALAALIACILLLAQLTLASADEKTLNIALGKEPDNLNPMSGSGHGETYDMIKVYSGLLRSDEKMHMVPDLAESWETSADGKTYTFHLKQGVKWHDGKDFSAEDVLFTYDLLRSGDWIAVFPTSSDYGSIEEVTIVDPTTVKFTLNEGIVSFLERFSAAILPKHILEGQDLSKTDFWQKPIGTGPYKFDSWTQGEKLIFVINPEYYGDKPKIDLLRFVFAPEETSRIGLLKSGEVDAIKIDPRSIKTLENANGIRVYSMPSANWYALKLPNNVWPFDDKKVRQAISCAINKQLILDTVFNGQGEIAYGPYRSQDWVYNPDIAFPYDTKKAELLLAEAGFKEGSDGVLEKDGKKLEFELYYPSSETERKDIDIVAKTDLEEIGIKVEPVGKSWDELTQNFTMTHAIVNAFGSPFDPDDTNFRLWDSKFIGKKNGNPTSYSNSEVDALLEAGRTTFDQEQRKQDYQKVQTIIAEDQPMVFLVFCNYIYAVSDKITGIVPRNAPHGQGINGGISGEIWWNAEQWQKE